MNIIPICPFCDKPLIHGPHNGGYTFNCGGAEKHFYGVHAPTEEEARALLVTPQQILVDGLSARIALPIEQRRHNEALVRISQLEYWMRYVHDTFKRDLEQGYKSRDKEFAVDLLGKALK